MTGIVFDTVTKRYPNGQQALSDASFELPSGSMTFLTGHSGAGKSTLLKLIMLLERPSRGQVLIGNQNIARFTKRQTPYHRRNIGVVFQDHQLLFDRNVFDNVALPLIIQGMSITETKRKVQAALDKVGLLNKASNLPESLSGGEQQRVGIARAVVHKPQILLADEPTGNLDPGLSANIMTLFSQFNALGVTLLIATHDINLIRNMYKPELMLEAGEIINLPYAEKHG